MRQAGNLSRGDIEHRLGGIDAGNRAAILGQRNCDTRRTDTEFEHACPKAPRAVAIIFDVSGQRAAAGKQVVGPDSKPPGIVVSWIIHQRAHPCAAV
jgi:hypothetical protein